MFLTYQQQAKNLDIAKKEINQIPSKGLESFCLYKITTINLVSYTSIW